MSVPGGAANWHSRHNTARITAPVAVVSQHRMPELALSKLVAVVTVGSEGAWRELEQRDGKNVEDQGDREEIVGERE